MKTVIIEIRDRATFIPALAIEMRGTHPAAKQLLWRAGYAPDVRYVMLVKVDGGMARYDPYDWGDRTMKTAHAWIVEHWESLSDGAVVDVEYILGETSEPKESEVTS